MTPFDKICKSAINNTVYHAQGCPFGTVGHQFNDRFIPCYEWQFMTNEYPAFFRDIRDWCWTIFCSSWFMLSWALVIGKE